VADNPAVAHTLDLLLHAYPAVRVAGEARPLKLKRGLALLAYLAEMGRPVSRLQVATLLWPEAGEALGRGRLRRLLHETHSVLGIEAVRTDGDTVALAPATSDLKRVCDSARVLLDIGPAGATADDIEAVLAPESGLVLDGFEIDSEPYAEWLGRHRDDHRRLLMRALQRLAEDLAPGVDAVRATDAAQRLIALDACAEGGHAALITALGHRGDAAAVESAYFRCAALLRAELGVRPSALVEDAYAAACARMRHEPVVTAATRRQPRIRFAQTPEGAVAYSLQGDGPLTMLIVPGLLSHLEVLTDDPRICRCLDRLAEHYRMVMVDRRGTGLSERVGVKPTIEAACEDIAAVLDHLGLQSAWIFGASVGGTIAVEFAAVHPERVDGLVLYGAGARGAWASDYPWAMKPEHMGQWLQMLRVGWGEATSVAAFAPSAANDPEVHAWWARLLRTAASQNGIGEILRSFHAMDVRHRLPSVKAPTLVIQRQDDRIVRVGAARHLAEHIPGAEWLLLEGADHWWWHGDADAVLQAVQRFVAASRPKEET
jgi:pimeloyl-ACP methyl ester carboxylesterase/DNA-binding SARP family transcriptional activator